MGHEKINWCNIEGVSGEGGAGSEEVGWHTNR